MTEINGKVWGVTQKLFNKNNVEINRIEIKDGGFCSLHKHSSKFNMFYVESGELVIHVLKSDYNLTDKTVLTTGQFCVVIPNEYHKFTATKNTVCFEIYYVELDVNDIQRKDVGGVI